MKRVLFERKINCNFGNHLNRDRNSVINVLIVFFLEAGNENHDFLLLNPSVNGEPQRRTYLDGLHRHTAPFVLEAAVDSMETPQ